MQGVRGKPERLFAAAHRVPSLSNSEIAGVCGGDDALVVTARVSGDVSDPGPSAHTRSGRPL